MSMNSQPELKLSTRTEQLASSRDAAMQKFLDGMTLIAEASAICGFSLFNSKIMALMLLAFLRPWPQASRKGDSK
ncbi:hypothetical protein [Shigella flexneri]|uniref:hypothetical protein n=1 Tax=Shigella flexneri TaxID=623 RepID=UPI0020962D62|nr:hypothetical protein [Shigella flexneri]